MAEEGRRTVIIRGQVADRYSPRRSIVDVDPGEWRPRDDVSAPGSRTRQRRPPAERAERRPVADPADRPQRSPGYEPHRSPGYERSPGYQPRRSPVADRRRRRPYDAPRARPDRIAMWAVLLGVVLILAAATSSHAAVIAHAVAH
jgi:hypothetical protein